MFENSLQHPFKKNWIPAFGGTTVVGLLGLVLFVGLGVSSWLFWGIYTSHPQLGHGGMIEGLQSQVLIEQDREGTPTIKGHHFRYLSRTRLDHSPRSFFSNGYDSTASTRQSKLHFWLTR